MPTNPESSSSPAPTFLIRKSERVVVVSAIGDLDLSCEKEFEAAMQEAVSYGLPVIVDLAGSTFFDCSSLRVLVRAKSRQDNLLLVFNRPENYYVWRIVEAFNLRSFLSCVGDVKTAITSAMSGEQPRVRTAAGTDVTA